MYSYVLHIENMSLRTLVISNESSLFLVLLQPEQLLPGVIIQFRGKTMDMIHLAVMTVTGVCKANDRKKKFLSFTMGRI